MKKLFRFGISEKVSNPCKIKFLDFDLNYKAFFPTSIYKIWYIVLLVAIFIPSPFEATTFIPVQIQQEFNNSDLMPVKSAGKDFIDIGGPFTGKIFIIETSKLWNKGGMEFRRSLIELFGPVSAYGETVGKKSPERSGDKSKDESDKDTSIHDYTSMIIGFIMSQIAIGIGVLIYF